MCDIAFSTSVLRQIIFRYSWWTISMDQSHLLSGKFQILVRSSVLYCMVPDQRCTIPSLHLPAPPLTCYYRTAEVVLNRSPGINGTIPEEFGELSNLGKWQYPFALGDYSMHLRMFGFWRLKFRHELFPQGGSLQRGLALKGRFQARSATLQILVCNFSSTFGLLPANSASFETNPDTLGFFVILFCSI